MPDCSWCNEHNCPATEENVSGKNRWFFAKSKAQLIEEINTKCARICGECAKEVQMKLDRSGTVKGRSLLGKPTSYHRELNQGEKDGLMKLREKYSNLAYLSDEYQPIDETTAFIGDPVYRPETKQTPREIIIQERERLIGQEERLKEAQEDPDNEMNFIWDEPEILANAVSPTHQEILLAIPMIDSYLRGINFITHMVCAISGQENRMYIDNSITGEDRLEAARAAGYIVPVKGEPHIYEMSEKVLWNFGRFQDVWNKYITRYDPSSPANFIGEIHAEECVPHF